MDALFGLFVAVYVFCLLSGAGVDLLVMMDLLGTVSTSIGFVTPHMLPCICSQRGTMASEGAHFQHTSYLTMGTSS